MCIFFFKSAFIDFVKPLFLFELLVAFFGFSVFTWSWYGPCFHVVLVWSVFSCGPGMVRVFMWSWYGPCFHEVLVWSVFSCGPGMVRVFMWS